ncbi:STAS domain-containing protein [Streptomyces sp. NPDC006283]|uniref:STAS domain-containing protein n=1 Tax=Streptomyces sp. NPDC006283 TaxID=3156741 RepID=UPI0033BE11D5
MTDSYDVDPQEAPLPQRVAALKIRRMTDPPGMHVTGEVVLTTHDAWEHALEDLVAGDGDVHLDLSSVTFVDVAGASAVAVAAQHLGTGRRMVLQRPPRALRRALEMFWPDLSVIEVTR